MDSEVGSIPIRSTKDKGKKMIKGKKMMQVTKEIAQKVHEVVSAGLVKGEGVPIPGKMCVEAAVCFAYGLPHGDDPPCVGRAVRAFKIRLNDSRWSSDEARGKGMLKLAIAQLGSDQIDQALFVKELVGETIKRIVPMALRSAASCNPKFAAQLEAAAVNCANEGTKESAIEAKNTAYAAAYAAANAAYAAANAAAYAAAYATDAAANAAYAAANAAANAANAAYAAANAAANAAAYAAADAAADEPLLIMAEIGLQALITCKSPGCEFLYLCDQ